MSPDAITAERIHRELRRRIVTGGFAPGCVMVTSHIAESLGTSVTPVRDALHQLVGEGLIAAHGGGGFVVPALDREKMGHLYRWHGEVMGVVLRNVDCPQDIGDFPQGAGGPLSAQDIAAVATTLFRRLASLSTNPEHAAVIDILSARLHLARCHEHVLGRCHGELGSLWHNVRSLNRAKGRTALWQYHRRRVLSLDKIMRALGKTSEASARPDTL